MIAAILIIVAATCKALADTLQHHYYTSIFRNKSEKFWNPAVSWKYVKFLPLTKYRADAWHLANSLMLCCLIASGAFFNDRWPFNCAWYIKLGVLSAMFVLVFNLFYNKIFIKGKR